MLTASLQELRANGRRRVTTDTKLCSQAYSTSYRIYKIIFERSSQKAKLPAPESPR